MELKPHPLWVALLTGLAASPVFLGGMYMWEAISNLGAEPSNFPTNTLVDTVSLVFFVVVVVWAFSAPAVFVGAVVSIALTLVFEEFDPPAVSHWRPWVLSGLIVSLSAILTVVLILLIFDWEGFAQVYVLGGAISAFIAPIIARVLA